MHNRTSISLLIVLLATAPAAARDAGAGASRASDPAEAAPPAGDRSAAAAAASEAALPASWLEAWRDPPASCRPLQIVHGIDPRRARGEGIEQITGGEKTPGAERRGMGYYRDLGLGGIVCNVAFGEYLRSEENWRTLVAGVEACAKLGLRVWIYDEDGYPSAAAGGLVLERDPAFEALALAHDPSRDPPLFTRPAYEHTHASNNFCAARRYPNLIDAAAMRCFIEVTHDAYWRRLEPHFGRTIEAFFTDEPSLMAVNLGQLSEDVRRRVRVVDPLEAAAAPLPTVPWGPDVADRYRERFGEDLEARRRSLFEGGGPEDRRTRSRFWSLVADLVEERFFGALQEWCREHRVASSGHTLWEEQILHHVPLVGNSLQALARMDIPGLDMLSSDPEAVIHSAWLTAALPASAAMLGGRRKVMTEVSDFSQKMGGQGPADLDAMQATAAWQAAWGVTEFTLYYGISDRPAEDLRRYCLFVGRLNAILREARPEPAALLYYPIHDLWEEYIPRAEPLRLESQTPRAQAIVRSFLELGQSLERRQIPFAVVDHERLSRARAADDGRLEAGGSRARALVLPRDVRLPAEAASVSERFAARGGRIVEGAAGLGALDRAVRLEPPTDRICAGRFERDGWKILVLVNTGRADYRGEAALRLRGTGWTLDPDAGSVVPRPFGDDGSTEISLAGRQTLIIAGREASARP